MISIKCGARGKHWSNSENNRVRPFAGVKWFDAVSPSLFILAEHLVHRLYTDSSFEKVYVLDKMYFHFHVHIIAKDLDSKFSEAGISTTVCNSLSEYINSTYWRRNRFSHHQKESLLLKAQVPAPVFHCTLSAICSSLTVKPRLRAPQSETARQSCGQEGISQRSECWGFLNILLW